MEKDELKNDSVIPVELKESLTKKVGMVVKNICLIEEKINNSIDSFSNLIKFCREDFSSLDIEPKFYEFLLDEVENKLAKSGYSVTRYYGLDFDIIVNIKD